MSHRQMPVLRCTSARDTPMSVSRSASFVPVVNDCPPCLLGDTGEDVDGPPFGGLDGDGLEGRVGGAGGSGASGTARLTSRTGGSGWPGDRVTGWSCGTWGSGGSGDGGSGLSARTARTRNALRSWSTDTRGTWVPGSTSWPGRSGPLVGVGAGAGDDDDGGVGGGGLAGGS